MNEETKIEFFGGGLDGHRVTFTCRPWVIVTPCGEYVRAGKTRDRYTLYALTSEAPRPPRRGPLGRPIRDIEPGKI